MKGIYFTWTNDPPNTKIKDWNVTELKVRSAADVAPVTSLIDGAVLRCADRPAPPARRQIGGGALLEDIGPVDEHEQALARAQLTARRLSRLPTCDYIAVSPCFADCIVYLVSKDLSWPDKDNPPMDWRCLP